MQIVDLATNHLTNPLGYALGRSPRFSWMVEGAKGRAQKSARIEVALDEAFTTLLYDTGFDPSLSSICTPLPQLALAPRTRYYWRVSVLSDADERATSAPAWFETAKLDEPWQARWISPAQQEKRHPILFRDFKVEKPIRQARAYVCGLGLYTLTLSGVPASEDCLTPGLCAYDKWLPYQSYDVTGLIVPGENRIQIQLGNGWYKGRYGLDITREYHYGEDFAAICELILTFEDGTEQVIASDTHWQSLRSCILDSSIFDGERRDDTLLPGEACAVREIALDKGLLQPRRNPPVRIMQTLSPVAVIHTPAGETVLDMGQNMVGWLEFTCRAPKGSEFYLQFGEVLQDGNFYRDNMRTALCEYHYVSDGKPKAVRPTFTFYGFRYVKLTKWPQDVALSDFRGLVLYTTLPATGSLLTANEKVNQLIQNTLWGQRGNFVDNPSDCPQRDERMGWTGDAQIFFDTAAYNMDVYPFYSKYCYDLAREQAALEGCVPVVIPKHDVTQKGACAWGDAATIIPWRLYVRYGDVQLLQEQYPSMKAWVDYIRSRDRETGDTRLWRGDFHYGDWLSLDVEDPVEERFGGTDHVYLASCYYYYSATLVSKAAQVLGLTAQSQSYAALAEEVRAAILNAYCTPTGRLAVNTQTAYVLALYMDILPPEWREQAAHDLTQKLKQADYHLRTGFIGTPYLCRVLTDIGRNDIAYRLLLQEDFPSWLYQVNMGATTIWERWNSILPDGSISDTGMNSLNHYSYGSIVQWLYQYAAGIVPLEEAPGMGRFAIAPHPDPAIGWIQARYKAPSGEITVAWAYDEAGQFSLEVSVPFGAQATLTLPEGADSTPKVLYAGHYRWQYPALSAQKLPLDLDTPVLEIYRHPRAVKVLEAAFPELTGMMLFDMFAGQRSLNDLIRDQFIAPDDSRLNGLPQALSAVADEKEARQKRTR